MQESEKNSKEDGIAERFREVAYKFAEVASSSFKNALELGAEAAKIVGEEAGKISENIPKETQMMAEGIMKATLGATSLFGSLIKKSFDLGELMIEISINKKEPETTKESLSDECKGAPMDCQNQPNGDLVGQYPVQEGKHPSCDGKAEESQPKIHGHECDGEVCVV